MSTTEQSKAPAIVFDLADIDTVADANRGGTIELFHPVSGKDLGIKIHLIGRDSDKFKQVSAEQNRRRLGKLQRTNFINSDSSNVDADAVELLANCTTGWENMVLEKKPIPFTIENAVAIYTKYPWMREQVDVAVANRANFTKA